MLWIGIFLESNSATKKVSAKKKYTPSPFAALIRGCACTPCVKNGEDEQMGDDLAIRVTLSYREYTKHIQNNTRKNMSNKIQKK